MTLQGTRPILMLVPHEAGEDPRIKWVAQLCAQVSRTDVIGYTDREGPHPSRTYDGTLFVDHCHPEISPRVWRIGRFFFVRIPRLFFKKLPNFLCRLGHHPRPTLMGSPRVLDCLAFAVKMSGIGKEFLRRWKRDAEAIWASRASSRSTHDAFPHRPVSSLHHFVDVIAMFQRISNALYLRARSLPIVPSVIICHDLYALLAGIRLKKRFGCPVLYDSHELWPEAFLEAKRWEKHLIAVLERSAIRRADAVITVTPQIAKHLESLYDIKGVQCIPNAEPFVGVTTPSCRRPLSLPVKFVLQGRVVPGRGTAELMEAWSQLNDDRAVLILRAKDNPYFAHLRARHRKYIEAGRIVIASPVTEDELVGAAASADVGIIPYRGPNLCHRYACPNKLSQYMQAGLAILCNADLEFVTEMVNQQQCGLVYQAAEPETLVDAAQAFVTNLDRLQLMKHRAYQYAETEFNWERQSEGYKKIIGELSQRGRCP